MWDMNYKKMKNQLLNIITAFILFLLPNANFGQELPLPDLFTTSSFALFTSSGSFTNVGASTIVTGNVGNNAGTHFAFPPGTLVGADHWLDVTAAQAATDMDIIYADLFGRIPTNIIAVPALGSGQILHHGVHFIGEAATLDGTLTFDGDNDPDAIFIIQIVGAIETTSGSQVNLINKASLCNVFWQISGQVTLQSNSVFRGTIVSGGAIILNDGAKLLGRGLTKAGLIQLLNNEVRFLPAAAGTITGNTPVCQGETGVAYSVPAIADAESYNWTLPTSATIASGANTNSITVDFSTTAISGDITVSGNNSCGGDGTASSLAITVNLLPVTSVIYHE